MSHLFCHKLRIALGSTKARATQANPMTLTESTVRSSPIDLIGTDHFWIMTMMTAIGSCLSL